MRIRPRRLASVASWPAARWAVLALPLVASFYVYLIWQNQSAVLDGPAAPRAYWLHDDMMISMRYGRNLAQGDGLTWNPGEARVEGYSNFGWVVVMAAAHWLRLPSLQAAVPLLLLNVILAGVVLLQTAGLMARLGASPGYAVPLALLAVVFNPDAARWTTIGLEVPLLTVTFLWGARRILDEAAGGGPRLATYLLIGGLGLIRADGLVLAAGLVLLGLVVHADRRRAAALSLAVLALPVAHLAFRICYYGQLAPNTYLLKLTGTGDRWAAGIGYGGRFVAHYGLFWLVGALGAAANRDRRLAGLWLAGLPALAYAIWAGGDDFAGLRFIAPWLPALFITAFLAPGGLVTGRRPVAELAASLALLVALPLMAGSYLGRGPGDELEMLKTGLELNRLTEPGATIGVFWAGTLPYFADRPVVDLLGKNDARIARGPAHAGSVKPGHNKFDYAYSLGERRPELLVSPLALQLAAEPAALAEVAESDNAYAALLFADPTFRTSYAPTLVYAGRLPIFIRQGSAVAETWPVCAPIAEASLRALGLRDYCRSAT